ncbi:Scavenger receptor cysteine-rich type 1 M130, partial [Paramuricea clavata]
MDRGFRFRLNKLKIKEEFNDKPWNAEDERAFHLTENAKQIDGRKARKKTDPVSKMVRKETAMKTLRSDRIRKSPVLPLSTPSLPLSPVVKVPREKSTNISHSSETTWRNNVNGSKNVSPLENRNFPLNDMTGTAERVLFASLTTRHLRSRREIDATSESNVGKTFCGNILVKSDEKKWKTFLKYSLFSWGVAVIITIVHIVLVKVDVLRFYPNIAGTDCVDVILPSVHALPIILVLPYIIRKFYFSANQLRQKLKASSSSIAEKSNIVKNRNSFVINLKLFTITSFTYWLPLMIRAFIDNVRIQAALTAVTFLTGFYIGLAFVFTRKIYKLLKKKYFSAKKKPIKNNTVVAMSCIGSDGSNEGKDKSPASKRQQARVQNNKKTVIVGDSIVKGLQQHKLSKAAKQNVGVKCFPGATVGDMSDYIKPVLRRKPDTVILHVGTNNATYKEASEIVNDIDKLCQEVKEIDPNVEIILSELTNREDNAKAKTTVQE